jgi:hypothetical protein
MYLFYVDESGDREIFDKASGERYTSSQRFYVLFACGILEHHWYAFEESINRIKRSILMDMNLRLNLGARQRLELHDAEIKSRLIRRKAARKGNLFWANVSDEDVSNLVKAVYSLLDKFPLELCAVVIDKEYLLDYFDWEKLHRKSYELLLERIQNIMVERHPKHKALVIADAVGWSENLSLIKKHDYFLHQGTSAGLRLTNVVQSPLFVDSRLSVGIQVSDVFAYSTFHSFAYGDPKYDYFALLLPHLFRSVETAANRVDGLKVFPPESPMSRYNIIE